MQDNFLVLSTHQVIDDVRGRGIAARVAEPLGTDEAFDDRSRVVYSAVTMIYRVRGSLQGEKSGVRTSMRAAGGQPGSLP